MSADNLGDAVVGPLLRMAPEQSRPFLRGARLREVVEVEFNHGSGLSEDDPVRRCRALYSAEGELLAWHDPCDRPRRIDASLLAERPPC